MIHSVCCLGYKYTVGATKGNPKTVLKASPVASNAVCWSPITWRFFSPLRFGGGEEWVEADIKVSLDRV